MSRKATNGTPSGLNAKPMFPAPTGENPFMPTFCHFASAGAFVYQDCCAARKTGAKKSKSAISTFIQVKVKIVPSA